MSFEKFDIQKQQSGYPEKIHSKNLQPEERKQVDAIAEKALKNQSDEFEHRIKMGEHPNEVYKEIDDANTVAHILQDSFDYLEIKSNIPEDYQNLLQKFEDQKNKEIENSTKKRDILVEKLKNAHTAAEELSLEQEITQLDMQLILLNNKYDPSVQ
jgi:hypothetical protein